MMEFPRLRVRPVSTHTCQIFRGLDRQPGASNRTRNQSWHWGWHDECNLSSDRYPRLSVRKLSGYAEGIDGSNPQDGIIAACGGDHVVLLDRAGYLWCSGHSVAVYDSYEDELSVSWEIVNKSDSISVTPATGSDTTGRALGGLTDTEHERYVEFRLFVTQHGNQPATQQWMANISGSTATNVDPADYGFTIDFGSEGARNGLFFRVRLTAHRFADENAMQLIRMGAYVIVKDGPVLRTWVNAVKLASGATMVAGTDYGPIGCMSKTVQTDGFPITLTLCNADGDDYSGVVVSATEPTQEGYWLDTSGDKPTLMEWSVSQTIWITVPATYVKVSGLVLSDYHRFYSTPIRAGDATKFEASLAEGTDEGVVELLNSSHYIYGAGEDYVILGGTLPSDTVTLTDGDKIWINRQPPHMDYVVEAQNRLWGCRYDESQSINEIYASKLGDFYNWQVFQQLSTDSWTASRGTAAPFTGAITLGGNPLFWREDSLEKVFPSSSGAHQIATYSMEGVQKGSNNSLVIINDRLYYKSRMGICVYSGTIPVRISEEFGDWTLRSATAARHKRRYAVSMERLQPGKADRITMVYDTETGDWHRSSDTWDDVAITWEDKLFWIEDGHICQMDNSSNSNGVEWYAESDDLSLELPEHKWISYLRLRFTLALGASCRVYMSYDGGPWERKTALHGNTQRIVETCIWPRRCDYFRIRIEGTGGFELQSISYHVERSQGGH